jgi:hypothetical protein
VREFYAQKAAECLLASRQVHRLADKNALLHMAATYIDLATFWRKIDVFGSTVNGLRPSKDRRAAGGHF